LCKFVDVHRIRLSSDQMEVFLCGARHVLYIGNVVFVFR
jgi:hypothetical protein